MTVAGPKSLNADYTKADHESRGDDPYARAKYDITNVWMAQLSGDPNRSDCLVLNVGCGAGDYNQDLLDFGFQVLACEPDSTACELARQRQMRTVRANQLELKNCGLFDLASTAGRQADLIVMHDVLEHIENESSAVKALSQLLKPRGTLILSVPALQCLFGFHDEQLGHFRRYSKSTLTRALSADFDIQKIRYFGFFMIPIVWWFSVRQRRNYPVSEARGGLGKWVLAAIFWLEKKFPLFWGTSVLVQAVPKRR